MIKLDDNLLAELGLHALPPEEKKNLLRHIYETLEMRVGTTLAQQMTDAQLDEFEGFINNNDEAGALHWLETNFPNYKDVVAHEFDLLKNEVRQTAPQILASVAQSQQQMAQQGYQQQYQPQYQQPSPQQQYAPQQPEQYASVQQPTPQQMQQPLPQAPAGQNPQFSPQAQPYQPQYTTPVPMPPQPQYQQPQQGQASPQPTQDQFDQAA